MNMNKKGANKMSIEIINFELIKHFKKLNYFDSNQKMLVAKKISFQFFNL